MKDEHFPKQSEVGDEVHSREENHHCWNSVDVSVSDGDILRTKKRKDTSCELRVVVSKLVFS